MQQSTPATHLVLISCDADVFQQVPPALRRHQFEVTPFLSIVEAQHFIEQQGWPSVLIVDGEYIPFAALDFCAEARRTAGSATMLLISQAQTQYVREAARPLAIDFIIHKPVQPVNLLPYVDQAYTRLQLQSPSPFLQLALGLSVDFVERTVKAYGRTIQLTRLENSMLHLLLNHTHSPLDQHQLATALWPQGAFESQKLRTLVSRMRRKLSPTGIVIKNLRGMGYLLEVQAEHTASRVGT